MAKGKAKSISEILSEAKTKVLIPANQNDAISVSYIPISELTLLKNNPRKISKDQFNKLMKSIQEDPEFFKCRPCLVNHIVETNEMVVYAGNQRIQAAKKLGWKQVPCIVEKDLDQNMINSRVIKDNQHYGVFDFDILANSYDIQCLLDAGFNPEDLIGDGFREIEEIEKKPESEKEKSLKMCPSCGHEF